MSHSHVWSVATLSCCFVALNLLLPVQEQRSPDPKTELFARDNLVAWCIVPFDAKKRGPEERAAMLERMGIKRLAYDYRAEHIPTFDAEMEALKRHGIRLDAWWFPTTLDDEARLILDVLKRHRIRTQLWVTGGGAPTATPGEQRQRVEAEAARIRPIAKAAAEIGCSVALYNHGGWFGEPANQIAIIEHLRLPNVGIVYNLHHGHDHLDRFPELLKRMMPHLLALNLNGMVKGGDRVGKKILPLGGGDLDLELLRAICSSGYRGPIGILNHTDHDAKARLLDNLDGLDWLLPQLEGKPAGPKPKFRTVAPSATPPAQNGTGAGASKKEEEVKLKPDVPAAPVAEPVAYSAELVAKLAAEAKEHGDARRGAAVFGSPQFACLSCHKVGDLGGTVGPELTRIAQCLSPDQIVEAVLWPKRQVKPEFVAHTIATADGKLHLGYKERETEHELVLRDPAAGTTVTITKTDIEDRLETGSLMPDGLTAAMTSEQRRDLLRFMMDLGRNDGVPADALLAHSHVPATFAFDGAPLRPELWPNSRNPVNRDRLYDFYAKEAGHFMRQPTVPRLLPAFPGLDGGRFGHWGNQNEATWADERWNQTELGSVMCGVFRGAGVTVPRGVCVRLGERGELAACFNPDTLCYEAVWQGGFVKFSSVRHGFVDGLAPVGTLLPRPAGSKPDLPFEYRGFYRHGRSVIFGYRIGDEEFLDAAWVEDGKFTRQIARAAEHPLRELTRGGPSQWPRVLEARGSLGSGGPYVVDTIALPFDNPWRAPLFFGDHDFFPDGTAMLCTMQGDVWHVSGLDERLDRVRWRRFASGLHHALGLVIADGQVYVLGRDQITRLHDLSDDGEADFYECFSNTMATSPAGHDFICGLQRDAAGTFYAVSGNQGLVRISADGKRADVLATGFRNPDGLGLLPDGTLTVPCSEGEWTPTSMICAVRRSAFRRFENTDSQRQGPPEGGTTNHFGYGGPRNGQPPELPLVYLPRGLDNSSGGGQVYVSSDRWGPLQGQMIHLSFGAGTHFLLLRDEMDGQSQGAVVPLAGDFLSGVHRGRFNPKDGQLYVSGMAGWGTYTSHDGCFQRVRYTGEAVQLPSAFRVRQNGVLVSFTQPVDRGIAEQPRSHFAQAWNYRYSSGYGSPEFSPSHPGTRGHDSLTITSAHVLADGRTLFLEIPDLQPVNQLHLHLRVDSGSPLDLFATVHKLGEPFGDFPDYRPTNKTIAAHPILADLANLAAGSRTAANPWRKALPGARAVTIDAGKNLTFATKSFTVRAGEPIQLTFTNPDVVPHNWALIKPGTLQRVGDLANRIIAEPDAAARQYIPASNDVLAYTDIVPPQSSFTIYFRAPHEKGRYPYLCTFPGHWMVMNGQMIVE